MMGASWRRRAWSVPLLRAGCFRTAASAVTPTSGGLSQPMDWSAKGPGNPCKR